MEQRSALPSINGASSDQPGGPNVEVPDTRPTSSAATGGRRALGMLPKSAGASSLVRRTRPSEVAMTSSWQSYENQAQRPSSTYVPVSSRGVSMDRMVMKMFTSTTRHAAKLGVEHDNHFRQTQQQDEHCQEPEGDSRDEVQQLREEYAAVRHENDVLRTKLVEKMRGQSKVVAGGQFRAASASMSLSAKVPITPSSVCTKCSTARARAIIARQVSEQAQADTTELRKYVDTIEATQQRLWDERSTHVDEIMQLRDKLAEKVEECVLFEAEYTKLDKQLKMMQPGNKIKELFTQQPEEQEQVDEATQCTLQQSCDDKINAAQLREISTLKEENQLLAQQLDRRDQELHRVLKDLKESQKEVTLEKERCEREAQLRLGDNSKLKRQVVELEQTEEKLRESLQDFQNVHQKELQDIQETHRQSHKDVVVKETALKVLDQHHKAETKAREQRHQSIINALKVRIEQKVADVDRLHALVSKHTSEKVLNATMKKQIQDLEEQVQMLMTESAQSTAANLLQQQRAAQVARNERDKLLREGAAEQLRLTEGFNAVKHDNRSLQTRISELEAELADHDELMQRLKRSHAQAMECLLESSLRLCVVAPTVNVQLNTNGVDLSSKTNNSSTEKVVMCRSTPQQDNIKRVIENDVLRRFTSVFLQNDDNSSPEVNVPLSRWLQDLLQDMQARISAQLESIYSTASANSSE